MMKINIDHGLADIQRVLNNLSTDIERKAGVRALNRVIQQAKTAAKREMVKEYSFKSSKVESTMRIIQANASRIEATVNSRGRRTRLIDMSARQTKKGTSVRISKQRKLIRHAFIAKMKSGHIGVFIREKGTQPGKRKAQILNRKIKELYTISIPEAFGAQPIIDSMRQTVRDKFMARFKHEIEWLMKSGR